MVPSHKRKSSEKVKIQSTRNLPGALAMQNSAHNSTFGPCQLLHLRPLLSFWPGVNLFVGWLQRASGRRQRRQKKQINFYVSMFGRQQTFWVMCRAPPKRKCINFRPTQQTWEWARKKFNSNKICLGNCQQGKSECHECMKEFLNAIQ